MTVVPAASAANQWAYAWAEQPTVETYSPDANHQGTSSGQPIAVVREGVGHYDVQLTGLTGVGGTVDITAAGGGAKVVCAGAGVTLGGFGILRERALRQRRRRPVDSQFYLAYAHMTPATAASPTPCTPRRARRRRRASPTAPAAAPRSSASAPACTRSTSRAWRPPAARSPRRRSMIPTPRPAPPSRGTVRAARSASS